MGRRSNFGAVEWEGPRRRSRTLRHRSYRSEPISKTSAIDARGRAYRQGCTTERWREESDWRGKWANGFKFAVYGRNAAIQEFAKMLETDVELWSSLQRYRALVSSAIAFQGRHAVRTVHFDPPTANNRDDPTRQ